MSVADLKPLRFWHLTHPNGSTKVVYGAGSYITDNGHYHIKHTADGWTVMQAFAPYRIWQQIEQAGLHTATFPRRKDALEALETFLEAVD